MTTETSTLADEHSTLLWQTCAHADEVTSAVRSARRLPAAIDRMRVFLHERLLPYLREEEILLRQDGLRDRHIAPLLIADHERLRADAVNVTGLRDPQLVAIAATTLVSRLHHHVRREEAWVNDPGGLPLVEPPLPHQWVAAALVGVGQGRHDRRAERAARTGRYVVPADTQIDVLEVYCSRCRAPYSERRTDAACPGRLSDSRDWLQGSG